MDLLLCATKHRGELTEKVATREIDIANVLADALYILKLLELIEGLILVHKTGGIKE